MKLQVASSLLVACVATLAGGGVTDKSSRIVNGTEASEGAFPFMVSVQLEGTHICGGTIVNKDWILTAAHCLSKRLAEQLSVLAGTVDLRQAGVRRKAACFTMHTFFSARSVFKYDIAVIKLTSPLPMTANIQPVKLPGQNQETPAGVTGTIIGWGFTSKDGPSSDALMKLNLETYNKSKCRELMPKEHHLQEHNICAGGHSGGPGMCYSDSGGPLIVNGVQTGVAVWSYSVCSTEGYPGVFTDTSFFARWIHWHTRR